MSVDLDKTLARFDFNLPKERIANQPVSPRDHSRILLLDRAQEKFSEYHFYDLPQFLNKGDVLVLNETRVFPARLLGKKNTGGKVELLLLKQLSSNTWEAISKPGLKVGAKLFFLERNREGSFALNDLADSDCLQARVTERSQNSARVRVEFNFSDLRLLQKIDLCGFTPLPPYIDNQQSEEEVKDEYQTVYAEKTGSSAAPTAGLHFTPQLMEELKNKGVQIEKVTLHVGLGTFAKLTKENLEKKTLHSEYCEIDEETTMRLNLAKREGRKITAVGTTTTRTLESMSDEDGKLKSGALETKIFIDPPYQFKFVDQLITNFHLPQSSLLMLVSAFTSYPQSKEEFLDFKTSFLGKAYQHAVNSEYRFFSFGDAMLIL